MNIRSDLPYYVDQFREDAIATAKECGDEWEEEPHNIYIYSPSNDCAIQLALGYDERVKRIEITIE